MAGGLASGIFGASEARRAARERRKAIAREKAANEAWYNREYYQDYLNTVRGQNAIKAYRNAISENAREARARAAVSGGTAEQAAAVAAAGNEAMGNVIGNIAAQGEQDRAAIGAQKIAMDANIAQQEAALADAEQAAGAGLINSGIGVATSALQGLAGAGNSVVAPMIVKDVGSRPASGVPVSIPKVEVPKKIEYRDIKPLK